MKTISEKLTSKRIQKKTKSKSAGDAAKDFDAVKMMRAIRDKLSREIMDMTFEEENAYLEKLLQNKPA